MFQQTSDSGGLGKSSLSEILANPELCEEIEKRSTPVVRRNGEILFREGDGPGNAFLVKSGAIDLTMHVSGEALWSVRAMSGSLVGLPAVVANMPYSMTATVLLDSQICQISREDFHQLMQENPRFCCNVLQILAAEVHAARKELSTLLVGAG